MLAQNPADTPVSLNTMKRRSDEVLRADYWELTSDQILSHSELIDEEKAKLIQLHLANASMMNEKIEWLTAYNAVLGETDYS